MKNTKYLLLVFTLSLLFLIGCALNKVTVSFAVFVIRYGIMLVLVNADFFRFLCSAVLALSEFNAGKYAGGRFCYVPFPFVGEHGIRAAFFIRRTAFAMPMPPAYRCASGRRCVRIVFPIMIELGKSCCACVCRGTPRMDSADLHRGREQRKDLHPL